MNTLRDLYLEQLQDIYSAETQLLDALPKMAWKARSQDLKNAFSEHLEETKGQVERLKTIFDGHTTVKAGGHVCQAMKGLIKEGEEALESSGPSELIDAHLIAAAFRVEHYEIAAYETAISLAEVLNEKQDADLLKETLSQESEASSLLKKLADGGLFSEGIHAQAVQ